MLRNFNYFFFSAVQGSIRLHGYILGYTQTTNCIFLIKNPLNLFQTWTNEPGIHMRQISSPGPKFTNRAQFCMTFSCWFFIPNALRPRNGCLATFSLFNQPVQAVAGSFLRIILFFKHFHEKISVINKAVSQGELFIGVPLPITLPKN